MTKQDAYYNGRDKGLQAIKYCEVGDNDIREAGCDHGHLEVCKECLTQAALASEMNARDFSPFEFLASEINNSGDRADGLWKSYDEGVLRGIRKGMRDRLKSERDYS